MSTEDVRMVIVVRKDLYKANGEEISEEKRNVQITHAALKLFTDRMSIYQKIGISLNNTNENLYGISLTQEMVNWILTDYKKIILYCKNESQLLSAYEKANSVGLPTTLIKDNGYTEFAEPTYTSTAILGKSSEVNKITKRFRAKRNE